VIPWAAQSSWPIFGSDNGSSWYSLTDLLSSKACSTDVLPSNSGAGSAMIVSPGAVDGVVTELEVCAAQSANTRLRDINPMSKNILFI
jgi:hypothetical protein